MKMKAYSTPTMSVTMFDRMSVIRTSVCPPGSYQGTDGNCVVDPFPSDATLPDPTVSQ